MFGVSYDQQRLPAAERASKAWAWQDVQVNVDAAKHLHVQQTRGVRLTDGVGIGVIHAQQLRVVLLPQPSVVFGIPQPMLPLRQHGAPAIRQDAQRWRHRCVACRPAKVRLVYDARNLLINR
eukprot:6839164-Prymnesium_polylepis.2